MILRLTIFILFTLLSPFTQLDPDKVLIAINCGGDEFTGHDGVTYIADKYYSGGSSSDFGLQYDIANTKDEDIYQTERWSNGDLVYRLPVALTDGKYIIILKFSEVYFSAAEDKIFDIQLGTTTVVKDLDIFDKVGKAKAHDEFIIVNVKNSVLFYNENSIVDAYNDGKQELKLVFKRGKKDNPKVNGILVYSGDIKDTDYAEAMKKLEEAQRKKIQEMKKSSLILKKHDIEDEFNEDLELSTEQDIITVKPETTLMSTLLSTAGSYIVISLIIFISLFMFLDNLQTKGRKSKSH